MQGHSNLTVSVIHLKSGDKEIVTGGQFCFCKISSLQF